MDIAIIVGLIGGTVLILSAIALGGSAVIFLNIPGVLIVMGGTLAASSSFLQEESDSAERENRIQKTSP